eukprot:912136_1
MHSMKLSAMLLIQIFLLCNHFDKVCSLNKFDAVKAYKRLENPSVSWKCPCGQFNEYESLTNYWGANCSKCGMIRYNYEDYENDVKVDFSEIDDHVIRRKGRQGGVQHATRAGRHREVRPRGRHQHAEKRAG